MTEQEIVNILKENETKGVAFMFMPEEVRDWVSEHFDEPKLLYLNPLGNWEKFDICNFDDYDNIVFALPDDYEVKREQKGEWVEFEINQRGQFLVIFTQNLRYYFNWFEWWRLLEKSIDYNYGFTAFGGWQYENSPLWFTSPQILNTQGNCHEDRYKDSENIKPEIPKKVRFWREKNHV